MKKKIICILTVATALTGLQQAQAGSKERYLIGGLLGGWIFNEVLGHSALEIHSRARSCPPVVVERHRHHSRPSGRYEYRRVKTWIPSHHERVASRCGRVETRWVPGYYDYRTEKVWVSYGSSYSRSYGHGRHASR